MTTSSTIIIYRELRLVGSDDELPCLMTTFTEAAALSWVANLASYTPGAERDATVSGGTGTRLQRETIPLVGRD